MNFKNSKFFKRIQILRRISKVKLRKERDRKSIERRLKNAFCENSETDRVQHVAEDNDIDDTRFADSDNDVSSRKTQSSSKTESRKLLKQPNKNLSISGTANGLIHLNSACYQIECFVESNNKSRRSSTDSIPSISGTSGSICICNSRYSFIGKIAKNLGFKVVKENQLWNILWTDALPSLEIYKNMKRFQQINHFPGMVEICRKDLLSRNLNRMLKMYPKEYKIFPKTWIFPADYGEALNYASNRKRAKMFIIKPDSGAQGRGIWLTSDLKSISPTDRMICQTYVTKPLLIDGYKFDLRVYALITSVDPLRIFVYNEGLTRLATNKYVEPSSDNLNDLYMHLTNYSVNRRSSQYEMCDDDDCGSKRNFCAISNWMRHQNCDVKAFWNKIDDMIIKTILSNWQNLKHNYRACFPSHDTIQACFEILGFDILVDSKMKPYILEVNHSPSFHTNEVVDRQVKIPLIRDTLTLIGTVLADKRQILREDRRRVKQRLLKFKRTNLSKGSKLITPLEKKASKTVTECPVSAISQQIAWEESHLGGYRRIMPPNDPVQLNYYCQFYNHNNQASIFANTTASKKREEVSKKLRQELEAKGREQTEMLRRKEAAISFEERQKKRTNIPRSSVERQRHEWERLQVHWLPGFISLPEERLRAVNMQMRADILKEFKVTEMIYQLLYDSGHLTKADIVKYPHLYRSLDAGIEI